MGTRNLTVVVHKGEYAVAQYGQWDGYPSGAGAEVCHFLQKEMDFEKFKAAVGECCQIDKDELAAIWRGAGADESGLIDYEMAQKFGRRHPEFSRDTAAGILKLIQDKGIRRINRFIEFASDSLMCEWAYVVDLDNQRLEVYRGFNKEPLPPGERFFDFPKVTDGYFPIKHVRTYAFKDATPEEMQRLEAELNNDDEN